MSKSERNTITPFEALSNFQKPEECDFLLIPKETRETSSEKAGKKFTFGYRKGDPNIYFHDHIIAGNLPLPKPLEEMDTNQFNNTFPPTEKCILNRKVIFRLWNLAHSQSNSVKNK